MSFSPKLSAQKSVIKANCGLRTFSTARGYLVSFCRARGRGVLRVALNTLTRSIQMRTDRVVCTGVYWGVLTVLCVPVCTGVY